MIEAFNAELTAKLGNPKCRICGGRGSFTTFLHGKEGKYSHDRACPCAITAFYDGIMKEKRMAPEPAGDLKGQGPTAGEGATLENKPEQEAT